MDLLNYAAYAAGYVGNWNKTCTASEELVAFALGYQDSRRSVPEMKTIKQFSEFLKMHLAS